MSTNHTKYLATKQQQIHIAYNQINSLDDINYIDTKLVKKLTIIHSKLQSLRGIEKFTQLTSLNLKFNNLETPEDLLRIANKDLLTELNLEGNTIQYYSLCTFASLRAHGFSNLVKLNNKDYSRWGKNRKKTPKMQIIHQKLSQIQKSMSKTLKRTIKNNVIEKYKFIDDIIEPDQQATSRYSQKFETNDSSKHENIQQNQKIPLKQISLSNVNMIKSLKLSKIVDGNQRSKGPQLFIHPIQYDQNNISHIPVTQPTATFAAHKQRQNLNLGMPFRKTNRVQRSIINAVQQDIENTQNDDQEIYQLNQYLSSVQRQSFSRARSNACMNISRNLNNRSTIEDLYDKTIQEQLTIAEFVYIKKLIDKTFKGLKSLLVSKSRSADMPCQRKYI